MSIFKDKKLPLFSHILWHLARHEHGRTGSTAGDITLKLSRRQAEELMTGIYTC